jgi:hypothetical protein
VFCLFQGQVVLECPWKGQEQLFGAKVDKYSIAFNDVRLLISECLSVVWLPLPRKMSPDEAKKSQSPFELKNGEFGLDSSSWYVSVG